MARIVAALACIAVVLAGCGQKTQTPPQKTPIAPSAPAGPGPLAPDTGGDAMPLYDTAEQYAAACRAALADARTRLKALETSDGATTVDGALQPANDMWRLIANAWNEANLVENVHPDPAFRKAADDCDQEFAKLSAEINLSRPLYERIAAVDVAHEDAPTQYSLSKIVRDFKRAGVDRDEDTRTKIRAVVEELNTLSQNFSRTARDDVRSIALVSADDLVGLPDDYIAAHPPGLDGKIRITTDYPDYFPFMTYAASDAERKALRIAQRSRGFPQNAETLKAILAKRYELARLLGYRDYASYITEDKMVQSPERAQAFVDQVAKMVKDQVAADKALLLKRLQASDPKATAVEAWQYPYLAEQERKERYAVDAKELRTYFLFAGVREGMFQLTENLFGIEIKDWNAAVWAPGVTAHEIWQDGKVIGRFYLDLFPREGKYKHAAHFPIHPGIEGKQLPLSVLVCNFPGASDPKALMEHGDVVTFLHEFGHLLHAQFAGHGKWANNSGISTEWDFVEAPSQLLEQWAYDYGTLKTFAINAAGQPIPEDLVKQLNRARKFGEGLDTATQTFYAALSLAYYDRDPASFELDPMMIELENAYSPFAYVPGTHFYASFTHLDGYSAMYYTYQWSLAIAHDLFTRFQKGGLDNRELSLAYRKAILDPGGSKPADQLVSDFLGRPFSLDAYRDWLGRPD
jgi:thimet oligopeptidase